MRPGQLAPFLSDCLPRNVIVSWRSQPFQNFSSNTTALPAESSVVEVLKEQDLESGYYMAPFVTDAADMNDPESEVSITYAELCANLR